MKKKNTTTQSKGIRLLEIVVVSINYIIITYALSNMALFFNSSVLFILFFASEMWAFSSFWSYIYKQTRNKVLSVILVGACFLIHITMVYFMGYISGTLVSLNK